MTYVTDTHPLVWLLEGSRRLSRAARDAFERTDVQVIIPTIVKEIRPCSPNMNLR